VSRLNARLAITRSKAARKTMELSMKQLILGLASLATLRP
jgi:hypothetical protein